MKKFILFIGVLFLASCSNSSKEDKSAVKIESEKPLIKDSIILYNNGNKYCEAKFSVLNKQIERKIGVWKFYSLDGRLEKTKEYVTDSLYTITFRVITTNYFNNGNIKQVVSTTIYDIDWIDFEIPEEKIEGEYGSRSYLGDVESYTKKKYHIIEKEFYSNGKLKSMRKYDAEELKRYENWYGEIKVDTMRIWDENGVLMLELDEEY